MTDKKTTNEEVEEVELSIGDEDIDSDTWTSLG
jgi:hypothetical protein